MRAAVFLDRDGVILENRDDYVKCWSEVRFLDGAAAALSRLAASPLAVVIVSNQALVGRGRLSYEEVGELHDKIVAEIRGRGGRIDRSYLCPHHPDDGCPCRKPAPGMLQQAARDLGLDLSVSWLVGDAASDLEAARAAGVRGILVRTGRGAGQEAILRAEGDCPWPVVDDLSAAVDHIFRNSPPSPAGERPGVRAGETVHSMGKGVML